jgi:hypothetical protein
MQIKNLSTNCAIQVLEKPEIYKDNISSILAEAIEESFTPFIKSNNIFHYLEKEYGLTKYNIPKNIEKFVGIIEDLFGTGSKLIEIKIIELIHKKIKNFAYSPKDHDLFLKEYLVTLFSTIQSHPSSIYNGSGKYSQST